jgi:signal peptidase I
MTAPPAPDAPAGKPSALWGEIRFVLWLGAAVLALHSCVAKPFYIPSESMMPALLKGDHLLVSKYPYGWSWVSATFHLLPERPGRLFPRDPRRGDIVIPTPPGRTVDLIKRVIGLPGDTVAVRGGRVFLNGWPIRAQAAPPALFPVDANLPCTGRGFEGALVEANGRQYCRLPIVRETLPDGRGYDTIDMVQGSPGDDYGPVRVPPGHVFLMGDNRDNSADSRFPLEEGGLGGPVPLENVGGRAEFITHSLDGSASWNPISWFTQFRSGRAGASLHPRQAGK